MTRKNTTQRNSRPLVRGLAALAVVLGAGLITAAPARAHHDSDGGFSFSFGFPAPFVPVPVPVYEPRYYGPRVVYEAPPVYYAPRVYYNERSYGYWRNDARHWRDDGRRGRDGDWHDGRGRDWDRD
jgi:hypothetical protein